MRRRQRKSNEVAPHEGETAEPGGDFPPVEILVCQAGSCRRAGSKAVLLEIEELAKTFDHCKVRTSDCLGACGQAPNATVLGGRRELLCTRIRDLRKSAAVVQKATGRAPNLDNLDPEVVQRLTAARQHKEQFESRQDKRLRKRQLGATTPQAPAVSAESAESAGQVARRWGEQVNTFLAEHSSASNVIDASQPRMDGYAKWRLESSTIVSLQSAIFHFTSTDEKRSTPHPRTRWRLGSAKTWHITLLANVGCNREGPSPWIQRDYTPISSWRDWEEGRCDILIKIYSNGLATSWLHEKQLGCEILLSQPIKTLDVPSLASGLGGVALWPPASVLLILAGTGIVVASQVLQHTDRETCFGPTPEITAPISLFYSCRKDDVLMIEDLVSWCKTGKLERCTLTITEPELRLAPPFPNAADSDLRELESLTNTKVLSSRLSLKLLDTELQLSSRPCRVVVSGPAGFNSAVKEMLFRCGMDQDAITILSA